MDLPDSFILTQDLLFKLTTPAGGYTKATLAALGIKWPPAGGWPKTITGQLITRKKYEKAMEGRSKKLVGNRLEGKVDPLKHVEIWTDGGCWKNPGGAGAWAAVLKFGEIKKEIHEAVDAPTTNNICELLAVINALEMIKHSVRVTIHTDSMYVIQVANGKKAKANLELVKRLKTALARHSHEFKWVQGHNGDENNERCDKLCNDYKPGKEKKPVVAKAPEPDTKPFVPPQPFTRSPSHHTLENNEARRAREELQMEMDRAIGF